MIFLDSPAPLLGVDGVTSTYWPTDCAIAAVDPLHCSRVLHLNDVQKFVFLDDALPLEVCFMADPSLVARINWLRMTAGLAPTHWHLKHIVILTPLPAHPIQ